MVENRRRRLLSISIVVACVLMGIFFGLEDWKRDLTVNHARLDPQAADSRLHPLLLDVPLGKVADQVEQWANATPRWSVESRSESGTSVKIHLTHRTRLVGFVDDVVVRLQSIEGQTKLDAESRSRVGVGDLGQNPRNLRELRSGIEP